MTTTMTMTVTVGLLLLLLPSCMTAQAPGNENFVASYPQDYALKLSQSSVTLSFECFNLKKMDLLTQSDPFIEVYQRFSVRDEAIWTLIGTTEVIWNNKNPKFTTQFKFDWEFADSPDIRMVVRDHNTIQRHAFLGSLVLPLGTLLLASKLYELVGVHGVQMVDENSNVSQIRVSVDSGSDSPLILKVSGTNLPAKDSNGKSDPFFVLEVREPINGAPLVQQYKSKKCSKTLHPKWAEFEMKAITTGSPSRLCNMKVWDWNRFSSHEYMGEVEFNVNELMWNGFLQLPLEKGYITISFNRKPTFVDFLQGGLELDLQIAIDYTSSNSGPTPSLHAIQSTRLNPYQKAIAKVGNIIVNYDYDKTVPMFGFGGRLYGRFFDCLPLEDAEGPPTGSTTPAAVNAILQRYNLWTSKVTLWGPTNFAPVIDKVANQASINQAEGCRQYIILLIITDGIISDLPETINSIVAASTLPLSIIIVGVGPADWAAMEMLDSDKQLLVSTNGKVARRDIVQFVPEMKESSIPDTSEERLEKHRKFEQQLLEELPGQVVQYMSDIMHLQPWNNFPALKSRPEFVPTPHYQH